MPLTGDSGSSEKVELVSSARRRNIIEGVLSKLPPGASSEERLRAIQEARKLVQKLGPEATELDILQAATDAVLLVAAGCERRLRRQRILPGVRWRLPWGATQEEKTEAEEIVCDLLDDLPLMSEADLEERIRRALAPLVKRIERRASREKLIAHGQRHVESVLRDLYRSDAIDSHELWDSELRLDLKDAVTEALEEELRGNETAEEVEELVASVVEEELEL